MIEFRHVASRFFNRPLLLERGQADSISSFLLSRMADLRAGKGGGFGESDTGETKQAFRPSERTDGSVEFHAARASRFYGDYQLGEDGRPLPYRRTADGTAILTLVGEWVNRGAWVGASSGLVSYEGFKFQMQRAAADPKATRIVLDMESPGGEAVGAFEAAAAVRAVAAVKSVTAVVNGMAASAAYAIASGASRIVTMPTGLAGSIGVVLMHLDFSAFLENEGIKPTLIFAGDHKVDGNPFEPLPPAVRKELQAEVSSFYDQFVETVAQGRKMSAEAVKATQARVFKGQDAVAIGLADEVGTLEQVLSEFSTAQSGRSQGVAMSENTAPAVASKDATAAAAALELGEKAAANAKVEGEKAGREAAHVRIKTILSAPEAQGRTELAQHLAFNSAMTAEEAVATLKATPAQGSSAKPGSRLDTLMDAHQPKVADGDGENAARAGTAASWDKALARAGASL